MPMTDPSTLAGTPLIDAGAITRRLVHYARPRQLLLVVRMAELGTVQKAAASLGMSQPSATQALTQLEALLEVSLFDRHARGVRLTRAGALLLPVVRRVMASLDALARDAATVRQGAGGLVRVFGISAASTAIAAECLPALCARQPDLWIEYHEVGADEVPGLCASGEADLVLCRQPAEWSADFEFLPLRGDHLGVYCLPGHPLAAKRQPRTPAYAAQTWLVPPAGSAPHTAFMTWCETQAVRPRMVRVSTRSLPLTLALLRELRCLYVGLASHMDALVQAGQIHRLPLQLPTALGDLGLLRRRVDRSPAVDATSGHLLSWFAAPLQPPPHPTALTREPTRA